MPASALKYNDGSSSPAFSKYLALNVDSVNLPPKAITQAEPIFAVKTANPAILEPAPVTGIFCISLAEELTEAV